jgi:hypothetical protein
VLLRMPVMRVDGVVAALSLVHANNQIQRLRSAIVDRYACNLDVRGRN